MSPVRAPSMNKPSVAPAKKRRSWWPATILLVTVILVLGWLFLWQPVWQEYRALPNLDGYASTKQAVTDELASLQKLTSEYRELTATDRKRLELALPEGQDIPNLLAQFEGMTEATNFILNDITFGVDKRKTPVAAGQIVTEPVAESVSHLKVSVVIQGGSYADLKEFITAAQESIRLLKLTSLTFSTKTTSQQGVTYNLSFRTAYVPK